MPKFSKIYKPHKPHLVILIKSGRMSYLRRLLFITYYKNYRNNLSPSCISKSKIFKKFYSNSVENKESFDLDLKINGVSLNNYIKKLENEYKDMCNESNYSSSSRWTELHSIVQILKERHTFVDNINNLKELLQENDTDIIKLAEEEKVQFANKIKEIDEKLVEALLPIDEEDTCDSIVLEVQAGVGGQEAMLFAKEIFDMYCGYADYKGWELEIAEYPTTEMGGVRHAVALINGPGVFQHFKHEAGIHRVQRIPVTEKTGRIHTSTISVTALPQPTDIQISINPKDLKIETKRSTGAGGQHVNTTDSAVRITHLPSGISVECQVDRSQIKNRKIAMARLNALLYQKELNSQIAETLATKKSQVRTKNRNEKIRTYNYNQDRITDHRLTGSNVHNIEVFFQGREPLDQLIKKLDEFEKREILLNIINNK